MMNTALNTNVAAPTSTAGMSSATFSGIPIGLSERDKDSQWYFTSEELANSPSRRQGIDSDTELSYRQMTAYLIQEMGQRLKVSQLCINTAIVYMHRFYAFHSFTHFHRNGIASASLFLAAKVEEQPRKLEHVIRAANKCLNQPTSNSTDAFFLEQAQDLVFNENVLLQTLGFDVAIDHPHTHVVKTCHLVKACKDLTKTSYFLASNSLHLTSMCLQYRPTVVACFCIYLACKWSRWEIPQSTEGKHWFHYVDKSVTMELLKQLTDEFIAIYEKSPARLKSKLNSIKALAQGAGNNRPVGKDKKAPQDDWKMSDMLKMYHSSIVISENSNHSGGGSEHQEQQNSPNMSIAPMLPPPQQQQQQHQQQQQQQMQPSQQQHQQMQQQQQQPLQQQMQQQSQMHQQQTQQKIRKTDMHSSQHRSQSLHSKHGFPLIGDMTDHKSSYKNQQVMQSQSGYNNGSQNASVYSSSGRTRDHSQSSQQSVLPPQIGQANQSSRSNMPLSSSSRGVPTNSGHQAQQPNMRQQVPSGGIQMDTQNYQKVRERSSTMHSLPNSLHNTMPPHSSASHSKLPPSKGEHSSRMQVSKESKHLIFGTPISSREYQNNQLPPNQNQSMNASVNSGNKIDVSQHDLSRGMMSHGQRSFINTNNNLSVTNPVLGNLSGYNIPPPAIQHRQQNNSSNSNSNNISNTSSVSGKLEHSKGLSSSASTVHMQSQLHKSNNNNMQSEASYTNTSAPASAHDLQQQQQQMFTSNQQTQSQSQSHQFSSMMRSLEFDSLLGDDQINPLYSSNMSQLGQQQSGHNQMKSTNSSSMFSNTDLTDNKMSHATNLPANTFGAEHDTISRPAHVSREKDRHGDRIKASASTKKEKHRHLPTPFAGAAGDNNLSGLSHNQISQQRSMQYMYKKSDSTGAHGNDTTLGAGVKRPMQTPIKMEDEGLRESKVHKIEQMPSSGSMQLHPDTKVSDMGKLGHVVNGIETNPDMVRNLLKESLCSTSALIKSETLLSAPDIKPPAELFATPYDKDNSSTSKITTFETSKPAIGSVNTTSTITAASTTSAAAEDSIDSKDRDKHKKNKKEKHKHKEKEKSKDRDRDERKKHKKDKDRHKEKERDRESTHERSGTSERPAESVEPFKIKIRKEVLDGTSLNPPPFKIKIPKERIIGDLNLASGGINSNTKTGSGSSHSGNSSSMSQHRNPSAQTSTSNANIAHSNIVEPKPSNPTLKIKISKDKIESYTGSTYLQQNLATNPVIAHSTAPTPSTATFTAPLDPPPVANTTHYPNYFTQNNQTSVTHAGISGSGSHSHSHHSSSTGSSSSSKKKDKDRDRSRDRDRDRDRDKKRHCGDSSRTSSGSLGSSGTSVTTSGNSHTNSSSNSGHASSSTSSSHSRTHSSNKH